MSAAPYQRALECRNETCASGSAAMKGWMVGLLLVLSVIFPVHAADAEDALLEKLRARLPAGWTMTIQGDRLELARDEAVYILDENRINAPVSRETPEETSRRIRSHGRPAHCRLVFRLEPRWSEQRWQEAKARNAAIAQELQGLPERFGISRLYDARASRKGQPTYTARVPADSENVRAWQAEHERLSQTMVVLPDYASTRYCLFLSEHQGAEDDMHRVDPPQASRELFQLENELKELCPR